MKDALGQVIYVGKSKRLRHRVQSYFRITSNHSTKIRKLITHIHDFDIIKTDTEFEALLLEWQLIQEIRPTYNRQMKTPEAFTYLTVKKVGKLYRMRMSTHPLQESNGWSFGPYSSKKAVNRAIQGLKEMYQLECSNPAINGSPCLNYSIGLCRGICLGGKAVDEHNEILRKFTSLLLGKNNQLLMEMQAEMERLSQALDFEKAATYRNYIQAFLSLLQKEEVMDFTEGNHQFLVAEKLDNDNVKIFVIWRTDVLFSKLYKQGANLEEIEVDVLHTLHRATPIQPEQVGRYEIDKAQIIYSYLRSDKCQYKLLTKEEIQSLGEILVDWLSCRSCPERE
ncbi:UvrB/UvrC motif-containing protein [Sutcliffiella rhizosphaerae]|nr:UvrB/UvrC motif-containing protein [Sutcliffiella rhizosphaerae]